MLDICHQKKIRDQKQDAHPADQPIPSIDLKHAHVRRIDYQFAKPIIVEHEWLGRMSATSHHYGLFPNPFFDDPCAGVVCYGGTNCTGGSYLHKPFELTQKDIGVLARGTCVWWAHEHSASYLIGRSLRMLKRDAPYKVVVAYSDPSAGELGTVYQATNWYYLGLTKSVTYRYVSPDQSRSFSDASIIVEAQKRGLRWRDVNQEYLDNGWTKQPQAKKHRYCFIQDRKDRDLVKRVEAMALDYPKRVQAI